MEQSIADASERECFVFSFYYSPLHALHFLLYLGLSCVTFYCYFVFFMTWGMLHLFVLALPKKFCILKIKSVCVAANPYLVIFVKSIAAKAPIKIILL